MDAGFFKGAYGPSFMVSVQRHFDRIEFVAKNTGFYFDPDNAISKASEANISDALLVVAKIAAEDKETGDILIASDKIFQSESFAQITPTPNPDGDPKKDFSLGKLDIFPQSPFRWLRSKFRRPTHRSVDWGGRHA
ncbi:MAG: hypothetical protein GY732_18035 [Gammaproteobacteria bacterium]|nr:hypothetical protein [Gammaproteobacteria bacterium]